LLRLCLLQLFQGLAQRQHHAGPAQEQALFELRSQCNVLRIELDSTRKKATGVTYIDANGDTVFQPANIVIASTFAYNNARLFLLGHRQAL
jgi:choline dehydrogenase-like flavoprotein